MHYYELYGLNVETPICFPEADEISRPNSIDVIIQFKKPPKWVISEYHSGKFSTLKKDEMWFRLNDELIIYVINGREANVYLLSDGVSELRIRSYILTGAMTFLLMQRDFLLIHGSALVYKNDAYLISGASGSGKSTTALSLLKNKEILFASDDICAIRYINGESILYPGPPWQKLCKDVKEKNPELVYTYLDEAGEKYARKITGQLCRIPVRVNALFILDCEHDELRIQELHGILKLTSLASNIFRGELLNILGITPSLMQQLASIASSFPIYSISRPKDKDTTQQMENLILNAIQNV